MTQHNIRNVQQPGRRGEGAQLTRRQFFALIAERGVSATARLAAIGVHAARKLANPQAGNRTNPNHRQG